MLGPQLAQNLYRDIESLRGQLEKVTNDHIVLQHDFVAMEVECEQEKATMSDQIDYLTELAGCGVPDDWVDDQGNEGDNCKAVNVWNKWQEKWCSEYQHDGDEKPKCWWELADMIDQRYDQLEENHSQGVQCLRKRDQETSAALRDSQKEVDALTKKNLEMAFQIDALETGACANISASENREREYGRKIDALETGAGLAAEAMGNLSNEVTELKKELDRYKNSSTIENEGYWFKQTAKKLNRISDLDKEVCEYQDQINEMGDNFENSKRDYIVQINELNDENTELENKNYDLEYTLKEIIRIGGEAMKTDEER